MLSERVQRQVDRLLDQAEEAIALRQWEELRATCETLLSLDPDNSDATLYLELADNSLGAGVVWDGFDFIKASPDETSLVDDQNGPARELIDFTENPEGLTSGVDPVIELIKAFRGKKDEQGWTPLHFAAFKNSFDTASLLIDRGADIKVRDRHGREPLHLAARANSFETARLLIDRGANVDATDRFGSPSLHLAASANSFETARLLIERGVDVEAKDRYGYRPLHLAARANSFEIVRLLIDRGAHIERHNKYGDRPLHLAARANSFETVRLLIDRGANVDATYKHERTRLYPFAERLIGKEPSAKFLPHPHQTPLELAVQYHYLDVARLLIDHGANTENTDLSWMN